MTSREAKDFLVQKTAEQAALENVPFSDLERRMMYFTEVGEMSEDPVALNDAFEAECDSAEYEKKISELMRHAYARLKEENPSPAQFWDEAVQELNKGDHYLLLLLDQGPSRKLNGASFFGWSFWKLLGVALLILVVGMVVFVILLHHADSMPPHRP